MPPISLNTNPIFDAFLSPIGSGNENAQIIISFDNLLAQSNATDADGTVTSFNIKSVTSGTLFIGATAGTASAWDPLTNYIIDANNFAYWTPSSNSNGILNAFTAVAVDNGGLESITPVQATVDVIDVNQAPVFENIGIITTDIGSNSYDVARSVTVQADGKILVGGYSTNPSGYYRFALVRYNIDGSLDTTFDTDGKVTTELNGYYNHDVGQSVTFQSDGKILVGGYSGSDFALVRYNTDGSLDTSFDGDGKLTTDIAGNYDQGNSVIVQADGKIVVGGYGTAYSYNPYNYYYNSSYTNDFAVVRYNADGSLDTSFNGSGLVTTNINSTVYYNTQDYGQSVVVQSDGKLIVGGTSYDQYTGIYNFSLVRYNTDGSLDTGFDGDGKLQTSINNNAQAQSIALQADGKILVAGYSNAYSYNPYYGNSYSSDFTLVRYNPDGSLDTNFDTDGIVITNLSNYYGSNSQDYAQSVKVQADGKIIVAGYSTDPMTGLNHFVMVRYNTDGSLDTSFDNDGKVITSIFGNTHDYAYSVALESDGKILVTGTTTNPQTGNQDFALVRYNPDGSLDTSFDNINASPTYTENSTAVILDNIVQVYDADLALLNNYSGASINLARHLGANSEDVFSAIGNLSFDNSLVSLSGVVIGSLENGNGQLKITFNDNATQAIVNETLSSLGYSNNSDNPSTGVEIDWLFSDGNTLGQGVGGTLNTTATTTVAITPINDAPTLSHFNSVGTGVEDTQTTITIDNLKANSNATDVDGTVESFVITALKSGSLLIGQTLDTATPWDVVSNNTIDASLNAYWTPSLHGYRNVDAFTVVAIDNDGLASSSPVNVPFHLLHKITGTINSEKLLGTNVDDIFMLLGGQDTLTGATGSDDFNISDTNVVIKDLGLGGDALHVGNGASVSATLGDSFIPDNTSNNDGVANLIDNGDFNVDLTLVAGSNGFNVNASKSLNSLNLVGGMHNDTLIGGKGNDTIQGGTGNNSLIGGLGYDTFIIDDFALDTVSDLAQGDVLKVALNAQLTAFNSKAWAASADVENNGSLIINTLNNVDLSLLTGSGDIVVNYLGAKSVNLIGSTQVTVLNSGVGKDILIAGIGNSTLSGGTSDDIYIINTANVTIIEGTDVGTKGDLVKSSVNFILPENVENLTLTGVTARLATGNELNNLLTANNVGDTLEGGLGKDTMIGGTANDTFIVDNIADSVVDKLGGNDTVISSISYVLGAGIENLILRGSAPINGTGNKIANVLTGNDADNILTAGTGDVTINGGLGNDTILGSKASNVLNGGEGNDIITAHIRGQGANIIDGGLGNDTITGGAGVNTLTGGEGADTFVFMKGNGLTTIADFVSGIDHIQITPSVFKGLSFNTDVNSVSFVANVTGTAANTSQHFIYNTSNGTLSFDADGTGMRSNPIAIEVLGTSIHPVLTVNDIWVG